MTERVECDFMVKEYDGGQPWIFFNSGEQDLPPWRDGFLGFDLPDGTPYEKAQQIADFLNADDVDSDRRAAAWLDCSTARSSGHRPSARSHRRWL